MVLPGFASGDLSVPVSATFSLEDAVAAYEHFQQPGKLGKVVIVL
jgi:NADPH:quinone reductase-like Zn-dependent oxidoreductase